MKKETATKKTVAPAKKVSARAPRTATAREITPREVETLHALAKASGKADKASKGFVRPRNVGATANSHHSSTLRILSELGYVVRTMSLASTGTRGSYLYKLSVRGSNYVAKHPAKRSRAVKMTLNDGAAA